MEKKNKIKGEGGLRRHKRGSGGLFLLGVWVKKEKKKEQSRWKHTAGFLGRTDGTAGSSTRHPDDGER